MPCSLTIIIIIVSLPVGKHLLPGKWPCTTFLRGHDQYSSFCIIIYILFKHQSRVVFKVQLPDMLDDSLV